MKILLLGECSNLHWTLAQGLRKSGHDVTVVSDGSKWMANERDIDLSRDGYGVKSSIRYLFDIYKNRHKLKGYDIVQIKNPLFFDLKAERNLQIYRYLKRNNGKVFLGAFGTDYFWIKACMDRQVFRYSDYFVGDKPTNIPLAETLAAGWLNSAKKDVNIEIADSCDGIVACLYEYYMAYKGHYPGKLTFIPEPVNRDEIVFRERNPEGRKIRFFVGIQKDRSQLKGTDILYKVLQDIERKYPDECEIVKAESVPYHEYIKWMAGGDVLLDQLYSYTPGMNALIAMAQGLVVAGGGEPEAYDLLAEKENRPVINLLPDENDIYNKLEWLIKNKRQIPKLSRNSYSFVKKHHDYIKVAGEYLNAWSK